MGESQPHIDVAAIGDPRRDYAKRPEDGEQLMRFFAYSHLKPELQLISKPFGELAMWVCTLPRNPERTTCLRKLLEAKDCAVRACVP